MGSDHVPEPATAPGRGNNLTAVIVVALVLGVAVVGSIGTKTLGWFLSASLVSLVLGLVLVDLFEPGKLRRERQPVPGLAAAIAQKS